MLQIVKNEQESLCVKDGSHSLRFGFGRVQMHKSMSRERN